MLPIKASQPQKPILPLCLFNGVTLDDQLNFGRPHGRPTILYIGEPDEFASFRRSKPIPLSSTLVARLPSFALILLKHSTGSLLSAPAVAHSSSVHRLLHHSAIHLQSLRPKHSPLDCPAPRVQLKQRHQASQTFFRTWLTLSRSVASKVGDNGLAKTRPLSADAALTSASRSPTRPPSTAASRRTGFGQDLRFLHSASSGNGSRRSNINSSSTTLAWPSHFLLR
ncbi:hypothetical protein TYRP_009593 [Tyrophagus putrescentiae]|nr:hypothetical protein TYRP_009593 [Tyrophagus putrescentiae]